MSNSNSSKQVLLSVIGVAILVVAVVGVSFAFFNYTRTGTPNTIRTGTISFSTTQSTINVENVFPVAATAVATDTTNVKTAEVTITGNTSYSNGIDFVVSAEEVNLTVGTGNEAVTVPLHVTVTSENMTGVTGLTLGSFDKTTQLASGAPLASGKIPANTNVNGKIKIQVYLDASEVAITDTYPEGDVTHQDTTDPNNPVTVTDYTNGTTAAWVAGRTVLTTAQWNSLSSNGLSFKIKVVANEGA